LFKKLVTFQLGSELIPVFWLSARRWLVINRAVICHYFSSGPWLRSHPKSSLLFDQYQIIRLMTEAHRCK